MIGPLPLSGLRAFAEVGRAGSMKTAAARLGVTPGAVSQQVKLLEARLGVLLFERHNRALWLTPTGTRLLGEVSEAFGRLEGALERIAEDRQAQGMALVVSTTGAFAATWLVPRLGRFVARHQRIDVRILTTPELVPVGTGPGSADVAVRHGLGEWPGLNAEWLVQPRLVPVGTPDLLRDGPPIRSPLDCLHYSLLHDPLGADWRLWLQALGADHTDPRATRGTRFADSTLLVRAAAAGQGLALLRDIYVADELATGRLQVALDVPWPAQFAYYIVTRPTGRAPSPQVASFTAWLRQEAAADG